MLDQNSGVSPRRSASVGCWRLATLRLGTATQGEVGLLARIEHRCRAGQLLPRRCTGQVARPTDAGAPLRSVPDFDVQRPAERGPYAGATGARGRPYPRCPKDAAFRARASSLAARGGRGVVGDERACPSLERLSRQKSKDKLLPYVLADYDILDRGTPNE
jgi:hypothetical protein